jgi:8-oxo-dGTP pyrophosphatase MutT (NUDIX family)
MRNLVVDQRMGPFTARRLDMAIQQAGGVILLNGRVVLRRTARGEYLFPKGHVEPGETAEQTAIREVAEETGLEVVLVADLGEISFTYQGEDYRVNMFLMRATGQTADWQNHLGRDAVLVPRQKVRDLLSFENYRQVWSRAQQLLDPWSATS